MIKLGFFTEQSHHIKVFNVGIIVLAVVLVLMTLLLATCVGIVLYMNRSSKPTISKSDNDNVKKKQPIPDIENLDMVALFGKKA